MHSFVVLLYLLLGNKNAIEPLSVQSVLAPPSVINHSTRNCNWKAKPSVLTKKPVVTNITMCLYKLHLPRPSSLLTTIKHHLNYITFSSCTAYYYKNECSSGREKVMKQDWMRLDEGATNLAWLASPSPTKFLVGQHSIGHVTLCAKWWAICEYKDDGRASKMLSLRQSKVEKLLSLA